MKILLIKMTSMGDLIHTLPAICDAITFNSAIEFHWVVDECFASIPNWHPSVKKVYPLPMRRWGKNKTNAQNIKDIISVIKEIRKNDYDIIIDAQGNYKSALVALLSKGQQKCGLDAKSIHEYGAHWPLNRRFKIHAQTHAITRNRQLVAQCLGYPCPSDLPDFNIDKTKLTPPALSLPENYLLFVINASQPAKLWPEAYWSQLIILANNAGYPVLLTCGNQQELQRAQLLAKDNPQAVALPILSIDEMTYVIARAKGSVCLDTGFGHIAGAFDIPMVHLFGSTSHQRFGVLSKSAVLLQADFPCSPCHRSTCHYQGQSLQKPACYETLPPEKVWQCLQPLLR